MTGKVNGCIKDISLGIFLKKFYRKRKKQLTIFYIFYECGIKSFLKWSIKKCSKGTR